jgi:Ca-activated chloride channel family protein
VILAATIVMLAQPPAHAGELPRRLGMYTPGTTPLAMLDSTVEIRVRGPIAEATVTQTFRNDHDQATEATYVFPLPLDAAVSAMAIEVGSRTIHAAIAPSEDAQRRYEDAVSAGIGAGLLDQERPDVFTQTVSVIPAHGTVKVTLRVDTTAQYASGTWQLVLPLVVAPRYVPGTASGRPTTGSGRSPDTDRAPDASRVTPPGAPGAGGTTRVVLEFAEPVEDVTSPTHELRRDGARYTFADPSSDHDAILRWRAKVPAEGWVEQDDDGSYAAILVTAPPVAKPTTPARLLLVLDRAATVRGDADAVEHPLVRALLGALASSDRAAVSGSDRIDPQAPDQVMRALDDAWPKQPGAFDLTRVLAGTHASGNAIVLVSDGLVADDRAAIAAARKLGGPIHVVGVGPAPNRSLLEAIASATGGTLRYAVAGDDLAALAHDVLADAASPPPPLAVTWGTLGATDVVPATLPRVGAGQAALVLARVKQIQRANARVDGDVFAFTAITPSKPPAGATTPRGALARRWARVRLDELVAANDTRAIAAHALRYGLVSPATSMIALGDEVVVQGGVHRTISVPVSVPAGMRWQEVRRQTQVEVRDGERPHKPSKAEDKSATNEPVSKAPSSRASGKPPRDDAKDARKHKDAPKTALEPLHDAPPPPVVVQSQPAPSTVREKDASGAVRGQQDDDGSHDRVAAEHEPVAALETPSDVGEESIAVVQHRRVQRLGFALALGGGLALEHGRTDVAAALSTRYERGLRTAFGLEGSLWLVGGDAQGELLATITRRGVARVLDLGVGVGARLGNGAGPALDLVLRLPLRVRGLAPFLRYDGALLFHDHTRDGQNISTAGVEASF